jgi:hypothetical protein
LERALKKALSERDETLRELAAAALHKIFQIPLDLSVQTVVRATPLLKDREKYGHIHYFNKEIAFQLLVDVGYEIIDYFYTAVALDLPSSDFKNLVMRVPGRLAYSINKDMAVPLLGGYRFLILAE